MPLTQLLIRGLPLSMAPLSASDAQIPPAVFPFSERDFWTAVVAASNDHAWRRGCKHVTSSRSLRVSVVGCSTTAGCGANDPEQFCSYDRSWVRHMHDGIQTRMGRDAVVKTSVYAKNAVGPGFFRFCTQDMVAGNTDVVLIEMMQNLFAEDGFAGAVKKVFSNLLVALRKAAPLSVPVFVNWLAPRQLRAWQGSRTYKEARAAAEQHGADWLDTPSLLRLHNRTREMWYAHRGRDHHPNQIGHALLGRFTAWYLAHRLRPDQCALGPPNEHPRSIMRSASVGFLQDSSDDFDHSEACYPAANLLPVHRLKGNWSLLNEGVEKGVAKIGYVSRQIGDALDMTLVVRSQNQSTGQYRCAVAFKARLGFLLSSRPGQGALDLSCVGCKCSGPAKAFQRSFTPFPTVQTDALLVSFDRGETRYGGPREGGNSISVTSTTTVTVSAPAVSPKHCWLRVKHIASKSPRSNASRVRVDSLTLYSIAARTTPC
mgnify:CR=1 FL=1